MPILIRYCLVSLFAPFILATFSTTFILNLMFYLLDFIDYLLVKQIGAVNSLRLLLYVQPSLLVLALPIGFLAALLVVFGRLSADREMMAVESLGFPAWTLVGPMLVFSTVFSLFLVVFMNSLLPWGNTSYVKLYYQIVSERSAVAITERVFIKEFDGFILYVDQKDPKEDVLKKVMVQFLDEKGNTRRVVMAPEGRIRRDPKNYHVLLELKGGVLQQTGEPEVPEAEEKPASKLLNMQFENCVMDLDIRRSKPGLMDFRGPRNMTLSELAEKIQVAKAAKQDTREMEVEYHKKFSIPFSALAFAFIGIPLGLLSRAGSFSGTFYAVVLVMVYWLFILYGETGGPIGLISPFWAMWLPNAFLAVVGILFLYSLHTQRVRLVFLEGIRRVRGTSTASVAMKGKEA